MQAVTETVDACIPAIKTRKAALRAELAHLENAA